METKERRRLRVTDVQLEVNYVLAVNLEVVGDQLRQGPEVLFVDLEHVGLHGLHRLAEDLVDNSHGKDGLEVRLFVGIEFICTVQMDSKVRHLHQSVIA